MARRSRFPDTSVLRPACSPSAAPLGARQGERVGGGLVVRLPRLGLGLLLLRRRACRRIRFARGGERHEDQHQDIEDGDHPW